MSDPGIVPNPEWAGCAQTCLDAFDFDGDADVDLHDFSVFELEFTAR